MTLGVRMGYSDHIKDNNNIYNLKLDSDDYDAINSVQKKSKDLMNFFGDCGGEYRRRA